MCILYKNFLHRLLNIFSIIFCHLNNQRKQNQTHISEFSMSTGEEWAHGRNDFFLVFEDDHFWCVVFKGLSAWYISTRWQHKMTQSYLFWQHSKQGNIFHYFYGQTKTDRHQTWQSSSLYTQKMILEIIDKKIYI